MAIEIRSTVTYEPLLVLFVVVGWLVVWLPSMRLFGGVNRQKAGVELN